ncbi:MAG TPA: acyl-CoA dehydrogenase family protein [bacterium]|nr:acyl-CoA dehydrogenase family protein [bacterium]
MLRHDDETIKAILDTAERFADRELKDGVFERDSYPYHAFAAETFKRAGEAGILFLTAPEDLGGVALPPEVWALVIEKLASAEAGFAASLLTHALAAEALLRLGNDGLKAEWIGADPPRLLAYPLYLDPSDPQGLPSAEKRGDGYILTGTARLVANAPVADAAVIAADMDGGAGVFLVPLSEETRPAPAEMLGLRPCPVGHLDLVDRELPAGHLLATGLDALAALHELFYPAVTAILIATHKASLDYALEYGMERYQGGRMIQEHSQLRAMYGLMAVENIALREAWLRGLSENGTDPDARLAVKIMAAELAIRGTMDGVQLLGGYGYTMEYPQEHRMRDARQAAEIMGSPMRQKLALMDKLLGGGKGRA